MPFPTGYDETDSADMLILKNEMNGENGQISIDMGYDPSKGVQQNLNLINIAENNAEDPTPITGRLLVSDLLAAINTAPAQLAAQQVDDGKLVFIQGLLSRELEVDISAYLAGVQAVFVSQAPTILAAVNASLRDQARYEVLFGANTSKINKDQWRAARES